jgi:uncharacterized protein
MVRWQGQRQSTRVEDRRGRGGGGFGIPLGKGGIGCGGLILILIISWLTGVNPLQLIGMAGGGGSRQPAPTEQTAPGDQPQDELGQFASTVLASTEDTWSEIFAEEGVRYQLPTMVLYNDRVQSACGFNSAAVGPFYCPPDQRLYLDLTFFREMDRQLGAPGDFAQAYVIAHEVGHHVQNQLGIADRVAAQRQRMTRSQGNQLSVAMELQADCLAGVWAHHNRDLLEPGDIEEGMNAAAAIGDDTLQRRSGGGVSPESWTHGSSEQRQRWLRRGLESGDPDDCDTFS